MLYPILGRISSAVITFGAALCRAFCVPVASWDAPKISSDLADLRQSNLMLGAYDRARSSDALLLATTRAWRRF